MISNPLYKGLAKTTCLSMMALFLLPILTAMFVHYATSEIDKRYLSVMERHFDQNNDIAAADKKALKAFYHEHPPSSVCDNNASNMVEYRAGVCAPYSTLWQFKVVEKVSLAAILAGAVVLLTIGILGALAFVNRPTQYLSFVLGWRLLSLTSAVEVIVQGSLITWLTYWLLAYFFESISVKLVVLVGICAAAAMFYAIIYIFKRAPGNNAVEGELVSESDAPKLWDITRAVATKLKTAPPDQIIAGIDTNFFVTESPLKVAGKTVTGRSLYVSIPLLRILDCPEAGAVLAHELAHLRGGDTSSSAALRPKLVQYDHYCYMMRAGVLTLPVYCLMCLYRVIFEFALKRDSREREFLADRIAAKVVSPPAIVQSLIKIAAYASYRGQIERNLFEHNQQLDNNLGIAQFVASGLAPYATSPEFLDDLTATNIPHPFDSHPSLAERMQNVKHCPDESTFGTIVTSAPQASWAHDIQTAAEIEQRLWSAYEQRFAAVHEESLAYRYEPANDTELAIVLKYFPPVTFELHKGKTLVVTYAGLTCPGETSTLSWDDVKNLEYKYGGAILKIQHPGKNWIGNKSTKVNLRGAHKQRNQLTAVLGRYWHRHKVMRGQ